MSIAAARLLQACGPTNSLVSECLATTREGEATRRIYQQTHKNKASSGRLRREGGDRHRLEQGRKVQQSFKSIVACYLIVAEEVRTKGGRTDLAGRNSTRHQPEFSYPSRLETPSSCLHQLAPIANSSPVILSTPSSSYTNTRQLV